MSIMQIPLTRGLFALVSPGDYEELIKHKWRAYKKGNAWYAKTDIRYAVPGQKRKKRKTVEMHRFILNPATSDQIVDHINFNTLDNTRENLRIVNAAESSCHVRPRLTFGGKPVSCLSKGVMKKLTKSGRERFYASISRLGQRYHLGVFDTEAEAAKVYNAKAAELFGQYNYAHGRA